MKKILYSLILLSVSAALFSQPRPEERPPKPEDRPERPNRDFAEAARERWEAMEEISVTGEINYVFEKRDGERPEIQKATIEKDGILYKIHFPIHLLDEEGIEPGSEVTVSGKSAPSMWMNDDSVSVFAKEIQSGDKVVKAPEPPRRHHPKKAPDPERRPKHPKHHRGR